MKSSLKKSLLTGTFLTIAVLASLVFAACSKKSDYANDYGTAEQKAFFGASNDSVPMPTMSKKMSVANRSMEAPAMNDSFIMADYDVEMEMDEEAFTGNGYNPQGQAGGEAGSGTVGAGSSKEYERKLIKNGNVTLQVQDLSEGESAVEKWCKELNGYISYSSSDEYSAYFTVKIPSASFDKAMESVGDFGQVKNRNVSTQDVSEQYYDLKTRLETKKILQANFKQYLEKASNITDILKIERELNNVTSDIESMEGQLRRLSNQIDFSTISINLILPQGKTDPVIQPPTFGERVSRFFAQVKDFFMGVAKILLYAVICGVPCIAFLIFLYWLLFGKLGLLKKLFKKLK